MKCPFCGKLNNKVVDSRLSKDGNAIRRRRECLECSRRFTTYEHIEQIPIMIIKKDGSRELFNPDKIRYGLKKACEKRSISIELIEDLIDKIERDLRESEEKELSSSVLGEKIMAGLYDIDGVAYVRFASVYREFKDVSEFVLELEKYMKSRKK
ncbi:NrdR transcriptional repressor [Candidatus Magnetomoraceae bacterium gMMP-15]